MPARSAYDRTDSVKKIQAARNASLFVICMRSIGGDVRMTIVTGHDCIARPAGTDP